MISIQRIVNIQPGSIGDSRYSPPSSIKDPKSEIGSWYLALMPSISDHPIQVQIHSVRSGQIRVVWPDKDSGILCYPYTLDEKEDSLLIEKETLSLEKLKSFLRKHGVSFSSSGSRIRVLRCEISVEEDTINVYRKSDDQHIGSFPLNPRGIDQALSLAKKVHQPRRVERLNSPVHPRLEGAYDVTVKPTYSEFVDE